jgi:hypothetical protein
MPVNEFQFLVVICLYLLLRQEKSLFGVPGKALWLAIDVVLLYYIFKYGGTTLFVVAFFLLGSFWLRQHAQYKASKASTPKHLPEKALAEKWDKWGAESRAKWLSDIGLGEYALFNCLSTWSQLARSVSDLIKTQESKLLRPTKKLRFRVTEIFDVGFKDVFDNSSPQERSDLIWFIFVFGERGESGDIPKVWEDTKAAVDEPHRSGQAWKALPANYQAALPCMVSSAIEEALSWEKLWSNNWSQKGPLMRILSATDARVELVEESLDDQKET